MSTGLKNSNSFITVRYLEGSGSIYYTHINGFLPQFIVVNKDGTPGTFSTKRFYSGNLTNKKETDFIGNHPVFHEKISGTIDYFLVQLGFSFKPNYYPTPTYYFYKDNWSGSGNHYVVSTGSGLDRVGKYRDWLSVSAASSEEARYEIFYNSSSTLTEKVGYKVLSFGSIDNFDITRRSNFHYHVSTKLLGRFAKGSQPWQAGEFDMVQSFFWTKLIDFDFGSGSNIPIPFVPEGSDISLPSLHPDTMVDDIYEQLTIPDVNNIENLKDLKDIKRSIPPIVDLLKKRNFKSLAEMHLWYKYSYSTTVLDLRAYAKFITSLAKNRVSTKEYRRISLRYGEDVEHNGYSVHHETRYHIYTDTVNCGVFKMLGLDLSLSNVWDLVPWSFVVDWFISFGTTLKQLDEISFISKLNIRSVVVSDKSTVYFSPYGTSVYPLTIMFSRYTRSLTTSLPLAAQSPSIINPQRHIVDGAALLVANKRFK